MTEPDDDGQPEARQPLTPRRPRRSPTGPAADGQPEARRPLTPRRPRRSPTGPADDASGAARGETGGPPPQGDEARTGPARSDEPGASAAQAVPTDDGDLEAVNRLMEFLRDPDTER